jgi:intraflagellar transport protein 122
LSSQEAEWKLKMGQWREAAELYVQCSDFKRATDIYINNNYLEGLIDVVRQMDAGSHAVQLLNCAMHFRRKRNHAFAKETFLKLNDTKQLMLLHIELEKWEEALLLAKQNNELLEMVKLPYAEWLCRNDRYEEALRAFKNLDRHDLTTKMLHTLSKNSVTENRFNDAAYYYWVLATECLRLV